MESSPNTHTVPMDERHRKDEEILRKIDATLALETTLHDGLVWAVEKGWMDEKTAEECERVYHQNAEARSEVET